MVSTEGEVDGSGGGTACERKWDKGKDKRDKGGINPTPLKQLFSQAAFPLTARPASSTLVIRNPLPHRVPHACNRNIILCRNPLSLNSLSDGAFLGSAAMISRRIGGGTVDIGLGVQREVEE